MGNPGNYSVTVTNNYTTISCSSTKSFEVRKSNIAMITSVDTKDWTDNQIHNSFTQRARAILNIQLTVLTSRIAINFRTSSVVTCACETKKRLWYSNRRSLFIDVPQILLLQTMDLMTLGKSNFQIMKLAKHSTI
jgi:hypothetical protein